VAVECQGGTVPDEPIDSIPGERNLAYHARIRAGAALRPPYEGERRIGEIRMEGHAEQAALRVGIDGEVERRVRLNDAVDYSLDLARRLFQDEIVVQPEEHDADRLSYASAQLHGDLEIGIQHGKRGRIGFDRNGMTDHGSEHGDDCRVTVRAHDER